MQTIGLLEYTTECSLQSTLTRSERYAGEARLTQLGAMVRYNQRGQMLSFHQGASGTVCIITMSTSPGALRDTRKLDTDAISRVQMTRR